MNFYMPTKVYHEREAVKNHREEMALLGKKALIVTGAHSSRENGSLQDVTEALEATHTSYAIFDRVEENPTVACVMEAALLGRKEGVDFVVGVGGGSPMDAAKAIALMIQNRDSSEEVLYQNISLRALPVVEVPTTCGTGSEVTPYAILTRRDKQTKQSISQKFFPDLALVDGKYLEKAPLSVITNTAIDALGHMLESCFHAKATDYSRMLCQYAMEVWGAATGMLYGMEPEEGDYDRLLFASSLAGMAISHTSTSLPHALSYYLTYHKGVPHGKAVGLFLPGFVRALPEQYEIQVTMALRALGFGSLEQFEGFIREMLGTVSLTEEEVGEMVSGVMANPEKLSTPIFEATEEVVREMWPV
ncbi:MAG: iron-containing alcohol dehydrogenase [Lachnospiraceae bacterium]|nr:iron-containing alcohol dehydrogenase [Lachnospiraceae bacterium]